MQMRSKSIQLKFLHFLNKRITGKFFAFVVGLLICCRYGCAMIIIIVCIVCHVNVKCFFVYVMTAIVYLRGISFHPMVWSYSPLSHSHTFFLNAFSIWYTNMVFFETIFFYPHTSPRSELQSNAINFSVVSIDILYGWEMLRIAALALFRGAPTAILFAPGGFRYTFNFRRCMHASCAGVCLIYLVCMCLSIYCLDLNLNVFYDIDSLNTPFCLIYSFNYHYFLYWITWLIINITRLHQPISSF